jgi:hypothetical protein
MFFFFVKLCNRVFQQAAPFVETERAAICRVVNLKEAYFCNNRDNQRQSRTITHVSLYEQGFT